MRRDSFCLNLWASKSEWIKIYQGCLDTGYLQENSLPDYNDYFIILTWRVCHHRQIEEGIAALTIIGDVWQLLQCIYPLIHKLDIANISDRDIFNFCDWYSYRKWTKLSSKWTVGVFDQGYQSQMFGYTKNAWIADKVNKIIFSIFL